MLFRSPTAAEIADAVWDEDHSEHATAGTTGGTLGAWPSPADFFTTNSGENYASAVAGSVVKEIVDNASGGGLDAAGVRAAIGMASANLDTQLGTIDDLLDTEISAIVSTIGPAGMGLTSLPWNAAWDAEVQSEVQDALEANNLDHLAGTAIAIPDVPSGTYIDQIMDDGTTAYDRTTDSLQAIRDRGDAAWTGGGGLSAQDVRDAMKLAPTAGAAAGGSIDDLLATVETNTQNIETDTGTDIPALIAALNDLTSGQVGDAVLDEVVEGSLTLRQIMRLTLAALANKASGGGTTTIAFRDLADSKARITATVDANGNRTAVTLDGS